MRAGNARWLVALAACLLGAAATAADDLFPRPAELQPDINFWVRVYSEISTNEGFIHDQRRLDVVYESIRFDPGLAPKERQARVDAARERYQAILRYLATGAPARDAEDQRVRDLWPAELPADRLKQAVDDVRFQLGQSDRFREGLVRAGALQPHIAATLAAAGLPAELATLPHVESSFDPDAYSKVGAAGLWQFMRSTGRRFMRIDSAVDERMDPYRSSEAAAQLLAYNYRVLGTWPLALTAYNHGAEGMRRARDRMGTSDIARIAREYTSPLFGFASRNFYVSFLAAQTVSANPGRYFGELRPHSPRPHHELRLKTAFSAAGIQGAVALPQEALKELNPALRPDVWSGKRAIPAGYRLRLPSTHTGWNADSLAAAIKPSAPPPAPVVRTSSAAAVAQASAEQQQLRQQAATRHREPVTAAEAKAETPVLVANAGTSLSVDAIDLSVSDNDMIRIAAGETLGHYADWLQLTATRLRTLNGLKLKTPMAIGRRLRLDFSAVQRGQFEERRRDYHQRIQAAYFAAHQITGSTTYRTRAGDSLWSLARLQRDVPEWLVQQYNPDVDFNALRPGTSVFLPQVSRGL